MILSGKTRGSLFMSVPEPVLRVIRRKSRKRSLAVQGRGYIFSVDKALLIRKCQIILLQEILVPLLVAVMAILAYGIGGKSLTDIVLLGGIAFLPLIINMGALLIFLPFSILLGPCLSRVKSLNFPGVLAGIVHGASFPILISS